jgi:hypothetical protein
VIIYGAHAPKIPALSLPDLNSNVITEVLVVAKDPVEERGTDARIKYIDPGVSSKFALLNTAAKIASGDVLCFIDGSTCEASVNWLNVMVGHAIQKSTGAVGARIIHLDKRIKHAGFILGISDGIGRPLHDVSTPRPGRYDRLDAARNYSAVSIDCLAIKRSTFNSAGGFDADLFGDSLGEVDLCLRLLESGLYNIWTPWAEVTQERTTINYDERDLIRLKTKWPGYFASDPFYNPNLTVDSEDLSFADVPRVSKL